MAIVKCVGVRFRHVGRIYYFKKDNFEFTPGDCVIVETIRGIELGMVVKTCIEVNDEKLKSPLKSIIRIASQDDIKVYQDNKLKEKDAFKKCEERIKAHNLPMKLLDCEFTFDSSKVLFYFSSDNRVDFRDLVKDLAGIFKIRIELRQIGVRDETKILGGFGACGRPLCCATFLSEFKPVSIKMVKEQGISLNPSKISGCCGRLMCCINHEEEAYEYLNKNMPMIGDEVRDKNGNIGTVLSLNTLKQLVRVAINVKDDEKEIVEYSARDLKFKKRTIKVYDEVYDKDIQELEKLEKEDKDSEY